FIILNSGGPFDIVSPLIAGNSSYVGRPAFAAPGTPGAVTTAWGTFDPYPYLPSGALKPGETIIPRNYGQSPGQVTVNLRISRTWGFGPERGGNAASGGGDSGGSPGGNHGPGGGGPR